MYRRTKIIAVLLALAVVLALGLTACGGGEQAPSETAGQPASGEKGGAKFGVVTPLSGGAAAYGTNFKRGIDLAVEEINAAGGITVGGKPYELEPIYQDDQGKSEVSATVGQRLASQDRVPAILTPASWAAFPMMAFNQQPGSEFIIMATSQTPDFTKQGNKLVVRILNSVERTMDDWLDKVFAYYDSKGIKHDKFAIMQVNTELGAAWSHEFQRSAQAKGKEIVGVEEYDANATDYYAQLTNLVAKNPDVIVLTTVTEPSVIAIKQAQELGFAGHFINSTAATAGTFLNLIDPAKIEGMVVEATAWDVGIPEVEALKEKLREKYNDEPQAVALWGYDGVRILAKAMEIAGTVEDPYAIREAMPQAFEEAEPLSGMRDLDETGEVFYPMYPAVIEGGKVVGFVQ